MFSFSHLSASHNSNNGNPKKHWRAPAWGDPAIWEAASPVVGNLSFGASEESIRALFETHGTVSLRLVPAQAPRLQRVRSPESPLLVHDRIRQTLRLQRCSATAPNQPF